MWDRGCSLVSPDPVTRQSGGDVGGKLGPEGQALLQEKASNLK